MQAPVAVVDATHGRVFEFRVRCPMSVIDDKVILTSKSDVTPDQTYKIYTTL